MEWIHSVHGLCQSTLLLISLKLTDRFNMITNKILVGFLADIVIDYGCCGGKTTVTTPEGKKVIYCPELRQ